MKRFLSISLFFVLIFHRAFAVEDVVGFWKTIDEKSKKAQSIIGIYEYQGKYYGRIVATYDDFEKIEDTMDAPKKRAPGVVGNPYYSGMDIIWDLKKNGNKFTHGSILDPEHGRIYGAEIWTENGNLIVRGKLLIFGRNQTWIRALDKDFIPEFKKPDLTTFVPKIPQVK